MARTFVLLGRVSAILIALALCSCVVPAQTYEASSALVQSVREKSVPAGKVRVLFSLGKMDGMMMLFGPMELKWSADLSANGKVIGSVNHGEVVAIDLTPGKYEMVWEQRTTDSARLDSAPVSVEMKAGQTVYLQADVTVTPGFSVGPINKFVATLSVCDSSCTVDLNTKKLVVSSQ